MRVSILRSMDEVQQFASQWESLPLANPFASWAFMRGGLARNDVQPFILLVQDDADRLLAMAPWSLRKKSAGIHQLEGIWGYQAWYHDPWIADASMQAAISELLVETLSRQRRDWDVLDLILSAEHSACLITRMQALGGAFTDRPSDRQSRLLDFGESWKAYLESRSKDFRSSLRRAQRKLDTLPHRYVEAHAPNHQTLFEAALRFTQERFDPQNEHQAWYQGLRDLGAWSAARESLFLYGLEIDGRLAAVNAAFRAQDVAFGTLQGYDPAFREYQVGNLLNTWALERMHAAGVRRVDLGDGAMPWKDRVKTSEAETVIVQVAGSLAGKSLLGWKRWVKPQVNRLFGQPALSP